MWSRSTRLSANPILVGIRLPGCEWRILMRLFGSSIVVGSAGLFVRWFVRFHPEIDFHSNYILEKYSTAHLRLLCKGLVIVYL